MILIGNLEVVRIHYQYRTPKEYASRLVTSYSRKIRSRCNSLSVFTLVGAIDAFDVTW